MKLLLITLLISQTLAHTPKHLGESRTFTVKSQTHDNIGTVKITQGHEGIVIRSNIKCLTSGGHGFHIHQKATCLEATGFKSAGSHIGTVKTEEAREVACGYAVCKHGFFNRYGPHEGDLPNIFSNCDGDCDCGTQAEMYNHMLNLFSQNNEKSALLETGAAIVIHEHEDEHVDGLDGIGNSGKRFACVEIRATGE